MLLSMPAKPGGPQTTVALISGHDLLRLGLRERIKSEPWIRLTQPTAIGVNVDELILHDHPDVIIVDCQIKNDVRDLVQRIKASAPYIIIILLCDMDEMDHLRQTLGAVIDAIVLKEQPAQVLFATIKHLMDIPKHSTPPMGTARRKVSTLHTPTAVSAQQHGDKEVRLTDRERHIVKLVAEGLSNKEIAARLHLADITVRHHLTKIFDKLGVSNRQNLVIHVHRHGIA